MTQKYNNIKILNAFSLTEVLVTMFIIMLLIIASAPMITRKNTKNKAPHGVWECYLNENGQHVSRRTINGTVESETVGGNMCLFKPQTNAKKYTVTVIGGGGGGASGTSYAVDATSYGSSTSYVAEAEGDYKILVVGGGGGGSASIGSSGYKGGGGGGVEYTTVHMNKGDLAILEAGQGGVAGGSVDPDAETPESSSGTADTTCTGTSWKDICKGKDGKASKFYIYGDYSNAITAEGGKGGGQSQPGEQGTPTCGNAKGIGFLGGVVFKNCAKTQEYMNYLGAASYNVVYGDGGDGSLTADAYAGHNGVVMLISDSHHAGGGGKRGSTAFVTLENITDEVKVYVGQGGAGAIYEDTNGEPGEASAFGYYVTAKGGEGGKIRYKSDSSDTSGLPGEDGAMSPYGASISGGAATCSATAMNGQNDMGNNEGVAKENRGLAKAAENEYGAGGGGGAAYSSTSKGCSLEDKWGKGGRGMPGYVRVEWN